MGRFGAALIEQAGAGSFRMRAELEPRSYLPYARHVSDTVIALDTRALMMSFRLSGASFETADIRDLNDLHAKLNSTWRNLADDRLAIWTHIVRRQDDGYPDGRFRSAFARDLDAKYRARIRDTRLFVNELYVTLVVHPARDVTDRAAALMRRLSAARKGGKEIDESLLKLLEDKGSDLLQYLGRYSPEPVGVYEHNGLMFSETAELLHLILTGRRQRVPLVQGHLGEATYTSRVIFGREALEIREPGTNRFGGIFGVKEYPASTKPGLWNGLLRAKFPLVATQSYSFMSKANARAIMVRKQNQMVQGGDGPPRRSWGSTWLWTISCPTASSWVSISSPSSSTGRT